MAKQLICNKCGKKFDIYDEQEQFSINRWLGYGTKYDGGHLELDLCCKCMEELIESCKVNPVTMFDCDEDEFADIEEDD